MQFIKDVTNKKVTVIRYFDAPAKNVWRAWTEKELIDQWWAPKPWKTETKLMDFQPGGKWIYAMVGPEQERHWCRADYTKINAPDKFSITEYFCDEAGNKNDAMPTMHWDINFQAEGDATKVTVIINFEKPEDLETIVKMGFEEGFTMALGNLDEYFSAHPVK
jgi:uncharacterized protein YndB with AHSA1/START domain